MTKEDLRKAIEDCDDQYLNEIICKKIKEEKNVPKLFTKETNSIIFRHLIAACFVVLILCAGVTVAASNSETFYHWITGLFTKNQVTKILSENDIISLKDSMEIYGEKETFLCTMHENEEDYTIKNVYKIHKNTLVPLTPSIFSGEYDGIPFSFSYVIQGNEILAYDYTGAVNGVFSIVKNNYVYASLMVVTENNQINKACVARLNLVSKNIEKISNDEMFCNFVLSPAGSTLLCNHRSDGYWSVLNLENGQEKRVDHIDGYARTDEIQFIDENHVLAWQADFSDNTETWSTIEIDLKKDKIIGEYNDIGNIDMNWSYHVNNSQLIMHNILNGSEFRINDISESAHPLQIKNGYILFGDLEESNQPTYLINTKDQTCIKIQFPKELSNVQMYLTTSEHQALFINDTEGYLVDLE